MNRPIRRFSGRGIAALSARGDQADAAGLLRAVSRAGRTVLSEYESKQLLALHDIPCIETRLAHTDDEAVLAATELGFPVTLKLHSHTLNGGPEPVSLRATVGDEPGVREAWQKIRRQVIEHHGRQHFLGITVQPVVPQEGPELFLHGELHPKSGPMAYYGFAGEWRVPPPDRTAPRSPIVSSQAANRTGEVDENTGKPPALEAPEFDRVLQDLRGLLVAYPCIREIDLRPLVVTGGQLLGLGAQIVLHAP